METRPTVDDSPHCILTDFSLSGQANRGILQIGRAHRTPLA